MNRTDIKRWYDTDPTVSLAMSFIRNLTHDCQTEIAYRIIEKCKNIGITANETRIILHRRWYDENDTLSNAMEYLKQATPPDRKVIALDIIDFLTKIK